MTDPFFSVVLPTYGRGRHIKPSIESVLNQTFRDFELIVVGDGCTDETEKIVRSFSAEQIRWLNLQHNSGSQSFPNNKGIGSSRGRWIAYIGHDDIWAPNHLDQIFQKINSTENLDFIVSGCIFYGPKGSEDYYITGLFEDAEAPFQHFCPPTSISHRRDVTSRMGGWRDPRAVKCPADNEFLLRAAHAGMRFASTSQITVHKFAAGHRYLSYLRPSSDEQREVLRDLVLPRGVDIENIVRKSQASNQYMIFQYGDYSGYQDGYLFEQNLKRKGLNRPGLKPLGRRALIKQTEEPRGLDWHDIETIGRRHYRWSGPNPRPKILIPYTGRLARISIEVIFKNPAVQVRDLVMHVEEQPLNFKVKAAHGGMFYLIAEIPLKEADYTLLTLDAPTFRPGDIGQSEDQRKIGLAVGRILIESVAFPRRFQAWRRSLWPALLKAACRLPNAST